MLFFTLFSLQDPGRPVPRTVGRFLFLMVALCAILIRVNGHAAAADRVPSMQVREPPGHEIARLEQTVSAGGMQTGKNYYHLGQAYFRDGNVGRAILNYRRAERYIPNDPNLKRNLEFARSQRIDKFGEAQKHRLFEALLFWRHDFSPEARALFFSFGYVMFWVTFFVWLTSEKIGRPFLYGVCSILILFLAMFAAEHINRIRHPAGVILADQVVPGKRDGMEYPDSCRAPLHEGTEFHVIEERGDWFRIRLDDGRACWIQKRAAELVVPLPSPAG